MLTNLKALRLARGLSQRQLADRAGITPYMVSYIESGHRAGTMRTAVALADALGVSVDALLRSPASTVRDRGYVAATVEDLAA